MLAALVQLGRKNCEQPRAMVPGGSLHIYFHAHPGMDAAFEEMLALRKARDIKVALEEISPGAVAERAGSSRRIHDVDEQDRRQRAGLASPGAGAEGSKPFSWTRGGRRSLRGDVRRPYPSPRCALKVRDASRELRLQVRTSVHTGECEFQNDRLNGTTVRIAAQILAEAAPGEIWVSGTTKDLVPGSGIEFEDRGLHVLAGIVAVFDSDLRRDQRTRLGNPHRASRPVPCSGPCTCCPSGRLMQLESC
jgi:hypothetical protein